MIVTEEQVDKLVELIVRHNEVDTQPSFSERKVRIFIKSLMESPKALILVNKNVTAVLALTIVDSHFSTTPNLTMVEFYSETAGSGFRLIKEARRWIDSWGDGIMYAPFTVTSGEMSEKMIDRLGWSKMGVVYNMKQDKGEG